MTEPQMARPDDEKARALAEMWREIAATAIAESDDERAVVVTMLETALAAMLTLEGPRALAVRLQAGADRARQLAEAAGEGKTAPLH